MPWKKQEYCFSGTFYQTIYTETECVIQVHHGPKYIHDKNVQVIQNSLRPFTLQHNQVEY